MHINAGAAGLALAIVLGRRKGWPKEPMRPHNVPFMLLGASLLWFGWFGFNAGSALTAGDLAGVAFTNTMIATCDGHARAGWSSSRSATASPPRWAPRPVPSPASSRSRRPPGSSARSVASSLGFIAGAVCALAVALKFRFGFDDSLDVVGVHLVGGLVGTLLVGFFGTHGGQLAGRRRPVLRRRLGRSSASRRSPRSSVMVYSFVVAAILALIIKKTIGFRVSEEDEVTGVDETEHAETAYDFSTLRGGGGLHAASAARMPRRGRRPQVAAAAGKEG